MRHQASDVSEVKITNLHAAGDPRSLKTAKDGAPSFVAVRTRKTGNNPGGVFAERRDFPTSRKNGEKWGTPRLVPGVRRQALGLWL